MASILLVIQGFLDDLKMDEEMFMCLREVLANPNDLVINFPRNLAKNIYVDFSIVPIVLIF